MSGILVDDGVVTEWNNMKLKHKYNFMTFSVFEDKVIVVDDKGKKSYDDFVSLFDAQHCKYAVVEVPGTTKLVFVLWAPDNAPVKEKMIYAASRQALLDKLQGHTKAIQASGFESLELTRVKGAL